MTRLVAALIAFGLTGFACGYAGAAIITRLMEAAR
jgi:hypothetical protein